MESEGKGGGRVDCSFYISCFKCPFSVLMVGIKCLLIFFSVNPGHVAKLLFLIALTNIISTSENRAAWRKLTRAVFVSFF